MLLRSLFLLFLSPLLCMSQDNLAQARQLFSEQQYRQAQSLLERGLRLRPADAETIELLGDCSAHLGQWERAASHYRSLLTLANNRPSSHYKYGGALAMQASQSNKFKALSLIGDIRNAFEQTIRLDPDHIEARWALVEYYLKVPGIFGGSESKANEYAEQLSRLSAIDGWLARARIAEYFGRYQKAEKAYLEAYAIGHSQTAFEKLLALYRKSKAPEKARSLSIRHHKNTSNHKKTT